MPSIDVDMIVNSSDFITATPISALEPTTILLGNDADVLHHNGYIVRTSDCRISSVLSVIIDCDDSTSVKINLSTLMLGYVVEYISKKQGSTQIAVLPLLSTTMSLSCVEGGLWEAQYIDRIHDSEHLYLMVYVTEYIGILPLSHLVCARVALKIRGIDPKYMKLALRQIK